MLAFEVTCRFISQVFVMAVAVLANAEEPNSKEKRATPEYAYRSAGPRYNQDSVAAPVYTKSLQAVLAKSGPSIPQEYVSQQPAAAGLSQSQQYYEEQSEPQAVSYAQPSVNKYVPGGAGAGSAASAELQKVSGVRL